MTYTPPPRFAGLAIGAFALLLITAVPAVVANWPWRSTGRGVDSGFATGSSIQVPASVAIGVVEPGCVGRAEIVIANPGGSAVAVERIESSCECLSVDPPSLRLGPGESRVLRVVFDSSREPDFVGELGIDVTARVASGTISFRTMVDVEVESPRTDGVPFDDSNVSSPVRALRLGGYLLLNDRADLGWWGRSRRPVIDRVLHLLYGVRMEQDGFPV